jgi:hypothetical protein
MHGPINVESIFLYGVSLLSNSVGYHALVFKNAICFKVTGYFAQTFRCFSKQKKNNNFPKNPQ